MVLLITFFIGIFMGWFINSRYNTYLKRRKNRRDFSDEIDLQATPDEYLSEVEILQKRFVEAKFQEMLQDSTGKLDKVQDQKEL
tara:strand:+ start:4708 stop:4959 length:252 start_codon:yes stop_codon:yes gene_type:complete